MGPRVEAEASQRVAWVRVSGNRKLGGIPCSLSERASCPTSCSMYDAGCYANYGHLGHHWRQVSHRGLPWEVFLDVVRRLPERQLWRHNEAGDLVGHGAAIDEERLRQLVDANRGRLGFTFTHRTAVSNHPLLRWANESGFAVNLSADSLDEADALSTANVGPVVTLLPHDAPSRGLRTPAGRRVVVCPAQTVDLTCATCRLCAKPLRKAIIGFRAHGQFQRHLGDLVQLRPRQEPPAPAIEMVMPPADKETTKPLSPEKQRELAVRAKAGDKGARDALVRTNLPFVQSMARKHAFGQKAAIDDLVNDGTIGLLEALDRYDPSQGANFLTYASWYVRMRMKEASLALATPLSGGRSANDHARAMMKHYRAERDKGLGHAEAIEASALAMKRKPEIVRHLIERRQRTFWSRSLQELVGDGDSATTLLDTLKDDSSSIESDMVYESTRRLVHQVIETLDLSVPDRIVVEFRLMAGETFAEVGKRLGVTRERARQREEALLPRLRRALRKHPEWNDDLTVRVPLLPARPAADQRQPEPARHAAASLPRTVPAVALPLTKGSVAHLAPSKYGTRGSLEEEVEARKATFPGWRDLPPKQRATYLYDWLLPTHLPASEHKCAASRGSKQCHLPAVHGTWCAFHGGLAERGLSVSVAAPTEAPRSTPTPTQQATSSPDIGSLQPHGVPALATTASSLASIDTMPGCSSIVPWTVVPWTLAPSADIVTSAAVLPAGHSVEVTPATDSDDVAGVAGATSSTTSREEKIILFRRARDTFSAAS
jgi:RNA polymerase sigma factor (sigma-70 family)